MTDWDGDSEQLRANLSRVLFEVRDLARQRLGPTVEQARGWQREIMSGLTTPEPRYVGNFRGSRELEGCEVMVGDLSGVASENVAGELVRFEEKLRKTMEALDQLIGPDRDLNADDLAAIIGLSAWAHSEWVRIHPFANGNGRTARLWANGIAMRYGLPPFVWLRPRPGGGYGAACAEAMTGQWQSTARLFRLMYRETIRR